jgi:hypothetical protein
MKHVCARCSPASVRRSGAYFAVTALTGNIFLQCSAAWGFTALTEGDGAMCENNMDSNPESLPVHASEYHSFLGFVQSCKHDFASSVQYDSANFDWIRGRLSSAASRDYVEQFGGPAPIGGSCSVRSGLMCCALCCFGSRQVARCVRASSRRAVSRTASASSTVCVLDTVLYAGGVGAVGSRRVQ